MFNLLPEIEKKQIIDEYKSRRFAIALVFLFVIGLIGIISIFPARVLSSLKISEVKNTINNIQESTFFKEEDDLTKKLSEANLKLLALHPPQNEIHLDQFLRNITKLKGPDIRINGFIYAQGSGTTGATLTVAGIARSRESLSEFVKTLRKEPSFSKVDLPVSSFTRDQNASFTVMITRTK